MPATREIRLKSRPNGFPTLASFELVEIDLSAPEDGEVQVKNRWMSVDPYMRGRMNVAKSYVPPFVLGKALEGAAIGEVVASRAEGLKAGDIVQSNLGWREDFNVPAHAVQKLDVMGLPPQAFLGVAGMPGLTAYAGLMRIAGLQDGDIVFVSGAAGAVGSLVCQIAKAKGHHVISSAGGPEKIAFLREIGVDHAIDYKAEADLTAALMAAASDGIDVYFDNVGGTHLQAALAAARVHARFALCGAISTYNARTPSPGPNNLILAVGKQLRLQGFIVSSHWDLMGEFRRELVGWVSEGKVKWKETIYDGLERAPEAFLGLFKGQNLGKMLVRLG